VNLPIKRERLLLSQEIEKERVMQLLIPVTRSKNCLPKHNARRKGTSGEEQYLKTFIRKSLIARQCGPKYHEIQKDLNMVLPKFGYKMPGNLEDVTPTMVWMMLIDPIVEHYLGMLKWL